MASLLYPSPLRDRLHRHLWRVSLVQQQHFPYLAELRNELPNHVQDQPHTIN